MFFFGFLDWIIVGLLIFVLIRLSSLKSRIEELESGKKVLAVKKEEISMSPVPSEIPAPTSLAPARSGSSGIEKFFQWYAHEWMLKTGALFILLGFIWFGTYAFLNNWIGPVGRITIGFIIGAAILYFGQMRIRKIRTQGITLVWLGAAVLSVTTYAAQYRYEMFPVAAVLVFVLLIAVLTAFISFRNNSLSLAIAGLAVAALAPVLTNSPEASIFGLYSYLTVVVIGTIWLARHRRWQILTFLALILISLYSIEYFFEGASYVRGGLTPREFVELRFFAGLLTGVFFLSTLLTITKNKAANTVDLITASAVGLFTFGWINGLTPEVYKGLVTASAALFYSAGTFMVFAQTKLKQPVFIYTGIAVVLLAIATAFQFDGPALVMALATQALFLPMVAVSLLGEDVGKWILVYFILPVYSSLEPLLSIWPDGLLHDDFYSLTIVTISLLISGIYFYYQKDTGRALRTVATFIIVAGGVYALAWIWRVSDSVFMTRYLSIMASLLAYTAIGLLTYITGEVQGRRVLNKFGLFTLIFVVGRLLMVDVWDMELFGRIITFFMIGALFMASVLLRRKKGEAA